jgi:tRNA pseudouridine55 synthase
VSAIKVGGKRSYQLARAGAAPELPPRPVTVHSLDVLAIRAAGDLLDVDVAVTCSAGTYVRALARDLGRAVGVGGHLTALRRTRSGRYGLSMATELSQLGPRLPLLPLERAAADAFPALRLTAPEARLVAHGGRLPAAAAGTGPPPPGPVAAFGPDGSLVALLQGKAGQLCPLAVFLP